MPKLPATISLALQGGGSHGAFTWGVLDRLLQEVEAGRLRFSAVSGTSAGGFNAALTVSGLIQGGAGLARQKLHAFWDAISRAGFQAGNALFYGEPNPAGGFNLDYSPVSIALEAAGLIVSPYTNPFYTDALTPVVAEAFPPADLAALNASAHPRLYITAVDISRSARTIFTQPDISLTALRASAALPTVFRSVVIDGVPYWDGGYLGNPALSPLLDDGTQDLLLVLVNPFKRDDMPPTLAPGILDRLREVTFNASVVLEINAIEAINRMLAELAASGVTYKGKYKPIRLHAIRNDPFVASLGFASKNSTAWSLLSRLHDVGYDTAEAWLHTNYDRIGHQSTMPVRQELDRTLKAKAGRR